MRRKDQIKREMVRAVEDPLFTVSNGGRAIAGDAPESDRESLPG